MDELAKKTKDLKTAITKAMAQLDIAGLQKEQEKLQAESQKPGFWSERTKAEESMKRLSRLTARVEPWLKLERDVKDLQELVALKDTSLKQDVTEQLKKTEDTFSELKEQLKFSGNFDSRDVIMSIHAGAGGIDAQDWADMLLRMYLRWASKRGYDTKIISQSTGDEAGLKSVELEIDGDFAYGKLKGEHGVHRLVRLSPFNADNLRQTSFAKVEVLPKIDSPEELALDEKDLKIDVFRAGGHGGQSVNTTDSAVRVTHLPTSITVSIQNERSQLQNKELALTVLRSKLAQLQQEQHKQKLGELKGPSQSAEWGSQIRSYVLHPYKQVKDLRTKHESKDPTKVLDGDLDSFINSYLEHSLEA